MNEIEIEIEGVERKQKGKEMVQRIWSTSRNDLIVINFKSAVIHCFVFSRCLGMTLPRGSGRAGMPACLETGLETLVRPFHPTVISIQGVPRDFEMHMHLDSWYMNLR
jgi:hypothetical protein